MLVLRRGDLYSWCPQVCCGACRPDGAYNAACCQEFSTQQQAVLVVTTIVVGMAGSCCPGHDHHTGRYFGATILTWSIAVCQWARFALADLLKYPQFACDRKCWPPDFSSLGGWYSYWRLHHPGSKPCWNAYLCANYCIGYPWRSSKSVDQ